MKTMLLAAASAILLATSLAAPAASACESCGCQSAKTEAAKAPKVFDAAPAVGTKATCPVMGGEFTVTAKTERSEYKGKHVAFCCSGCKGKFDADPKKYTH